MNYLFIVGDLLVCGFMVLLVAVLMSNYSEQSFDHVKRIPIQND